MAEAEPTTADIVGDAISQLAGVLAGLQQTADQLVVEMKAAREDVTKQGRRSRAFSSIGAGLAFLVLIVASMAWLQARAGQSEQAGRDAQTTMVIEAIQACTSPGHACYDENQGRSNQRLAPIVVVICALAKASGVPPDQMRPLCPAG